MEKIVVGLIYSSLVLLAKYLYSMRQLYAIVPKLYKVSELSSNGSIFEINIVNKGKKVEENIRLQLQKSIKCELLASNSSDVSVSDNLITIPRLHAKSDLSLILASDDEEITIDKLVSLSSKECKGKIIKTIEEIPPNYFNLAMFGIFVLTMLIIFSWYPEINSYIKKLFNPQEKITKKVNTSISHNIKPILKFNTTKIKLKKKKTEKQILQNKTKVNIMAKGWENIDRYLTSDLSSSYSPQEFPIRYIETKIDGRLAKLKFEIINKTALPIKVIINGLPRGGIKTYKNHAWYACFKSINIPTMSKKIVTIDNVRSKHNFVDLNFTITYGSEYIYDVISKFKVKPWKKLSDDEMKKRLVGQWKFSQKYMYGEVMYHDDGTYITSLWFDLRKKKKNFIFKGKWYIQDTNLYHNQENIVQGKAPYPKGMKANTKIIDITKTRLVLNDDEDNLFIVRYKIKKDVDNATK